MLFAKSAFVLSFLALGNIAAAAGTQSCLLEALSTEPSPGDLKAVCVDKVQTRIESLCSGDDKQDALKQFADTCSFAGHKVVVNTSTSSGASSTGTSTAGSKPSSSGFVTATATSSSGIFPLLPLLQLSLSASPLRCKGDQPSNRSTQLRSEYRVSGGMT
ncbi:hypothetical protein BDV40DRAFT_55148 [Aspergillus tamarii]|uniref:GPI anchored cell wall protein n=1 Tax=Aspergillus tamarii TaxID=41984 RepID=A0A5N6UG07_ASPTM|nr:hypothetical protein BDV40DRAFT_55148 [Aspergillus tamarii]